MFGSFLIQTKHVGALEEFKVCCCKSKDFKVTSPEKLEPKAPFYLLKSSGLGSDSEWPDIADW